MRRRQWLVMVALVAAGCTPAKKGKKKVSGRERLHRGPQGFGNLLVSGYIDDLKKGPAAKRITAANQLAKMGDEAKAALPALEKLTRDKNPDVSAAAKAALTSLKKN